MNKCKICQHPHTVEIDSLLDSGAFKKNIARQFNVSYPSLVRHAARHGKNAPAPAAPENSESLEAQAEKWLRRADDIYEASTANQDARGQVASLGAAFRGLELQHKAELKKLEAAPATDGITLDMIDEIIQRAMGDRRSGLIDRIFAADAGTLAAVESILAEKVN